MLQFYSGAIGWKRHLNLNTLMLEMQRGGLNPVQTSCLSRPAETEYKMLYH